MGEEKGWREVVERGSYFFSKEKIFESSPINTLSKVEEDDESGAEGTPLVKRKWVWSKDQWQTRALPLVKTLFCFGGLAGAVVGIRRGQLYGLHRQMGNKDTQMMSRGRFILNCMAIEGTRTSLIMAVKWPFLATSFLTTQIGMEAIREVDDYKNGMVAGSVVLSMFAFPSTGWMGSVAGIFFGAPFGAIARPLFSGFSQWRADCLDDFLNSFLSKQSQNIEEEE